ncbi:MAG: alpha/beta fold hydrolase [Ardenticatenia bacterium]|nr:alpha/beta fold hydrolase [Ardenticatenia bacterium]
MGTNRRAGMFGVGVLLGALAAAYDKWAADQADPLHSRLAGTGHYYDWREARAFYKVYGEGPPVLLLHSIHPAASGWEMRRVHEFLALNGFRVYTPDLPGFGLSTRPALRYTHDLYARFIRDVVRDVIGQETIVIAAGLTAGCVVVAAAMEPSLFGPLVLVSPVGIGRWARRPWWGLLVEQVLRAPGLGQTLFNLLVSRPALQWLLGSTLYHDRANMAGDTLHLWYTVSHQPNARLAPAALLGGALNRSIRREFAALQQPILLVWGYQARLVPSTDGPAFFQVNPRAELVGVDAGLLPHEEAADQFNRHVLRWLHRCLEEAGRASELRLRVVM